MPDDESPIICLNFCMLDAETGYCLTCGRPPIPVSSIDLAPKTFAGISLKSMALAMEKSETPDEDAS